MTVSGIDPRATARTLARYYRLSSNPIHHAFYRGGLHELRQHVGIDDDHLTGRGGSRIG